MKTTTQTMSNGRTFITSIDNSQRVFLIEREGFGERYFFCNLSQIPECLAQLETNDNFTVKHFWNFKFKRISKKGLNELFAANQINFKIK